MDVLVIGAGQAGLGTGYWLARRSSASFVLLEAAPTVGHSWRQRWDSLTLFTPRRFSALPGLRFPPGPGKYPTRDEMADYLQLYATRFGLPVRLDRRVESVEPTEGSLVTRTADGLVVGARHVVVATGPFSAPFVPAASDGLAPGVSQLHSSNYHSPADVATADVLVVGGGNSAAQLACELAATHQVTIASPGPLWFLPDTIGPVNLYWSLYLAGVLNASSDAWVSRYVRARGDAIIGRELAEAVTSGRVRHLPQRVVGGRGDEVVLADGGRVRVSTVLWCTGFRPDYPWLRVPGALDADGAPMHRAGASPVPGLHWMGLPWQSRLNSSLIDGVDRDARATVARITR